MSRKQHIKPLPAGPTMTERDVIRSLVSAAKECGWLVYHTWLSKFSQAGFPDLCLVKNGRLLFWEVKSAKGEVSEPQQAWLDALAQVPGVEDALVIRPDDLEEAYKRLATVG